MTNITKLSICFFSYILINIISCYFAFSSNYVTDIVALIEIAYTSFIFAAILTVIVDEIVLYIKKKNK